MNTFNLINDDCLNALKEIEDNSIDSIITDPPYGLSKTPDIVEVMSKWLAGEDYTHRGSGFMGKSWDSFVPGPAVWRECFRVLKPGGHLIAFAGSRTYDLMALACRFGGFEIRDQGMWLYGSGFPKSLDVSKAVDKLDASKTRRDRQLRFTSWMRETGLTSSQIDRLTNTNMGGHYLALASQPAVPTRDLFEMLRPHISIPVPEWVEELINERTVESENFKGREVVGHSANGIAGGSGEFTSGNERSAGFKAEFDLTKAKTPEAQKWEGWGTALKPAHEPFVIARKPFKGTVADNVLEHGTGGINVDGCRVGDEIISSHNAPKGTFAGGEYDRGSETIYRHTEGRFPANLLHDGSEAVEDVLGDKARYFYSAKAGKKDRNEGLEDSKNNHPTVKPVDLMAYLCRLITPEGGTVLDPFTGSGSTGKAAIREGFKFIGIEMDSEYCEIAKARIEFEINKT